VGNLSRPLPNPLAPPAYICAASPSARPEWFAVFVGAVGIAFGLGSAALITHLVARPVDELRAAFASVGAGNLRIHLPLRRADEFGALVADFNGIVAGLREKERVRRIFGLHVGKKVTQEILKSRSRARRHRTNHHCHVPRYPWLHRAGRRG
jgi:HAMP domain-containing protein